MFLPLRLSFLEMQITPFLQFYQRVAVERLLFLCKRGFCMLDRKKYEDYWYAFQEKLDKLLAEHKMSYRTLSVEIGKSPGYIYDVVNRRIDPSFESLFEIAEYFGCTVWDFLDITK